MTPNEKCSVVFHCESAKFGHSVQDQVYGVEANTNYTTPKIKSEQTFDVRFFGLVRIPDILGVAK